MHIGHQNEVRKGVLESWISVCSDYVLLKDPREYRSYWDRPKITRLGLFVNLRHRCDDRLPPLLWYVAFCKHLIEQLRDGSREHRCAIYRNGSNGLTAPLRPLRYARAVVEGYHGRLVRSIATYSVTIKRRYARLGRKGHGDIYRHPTTPWMVHRENHIGPIALPQLVPSVTKNRQLYQHPKNKKLIYRRDSVRGLKRPFKVTRGHP